MLLNDINFSKLTLEERNGTRITLPLFYDDHFYYKIIHEISPYVKLSSAYYTLEGLDLVWQGTKQMAIEKVGLLSTDIVPAFYKFIYHNDQCCGYVMHRGVLIENTNYSDIDYIKFLKLLVDKSIQCGWAIPSVGKHNIIEYNGKLSLIDLDFNPISLTHNRLLNNFEIQIWENEFHSDDLLYLKMIKNKLNA